MIDKPGTYPMPADEYHRDPCVVPSLSRGIAKRLVDQSPMHARWHHPRLNSELERSTANHLSLGQLCHRLYLGSGAEVAVCEAKDWKTKAAREFRDLALEAGEIPVTEPQMERAERIVAAAEAQVGALTGGHAELAWFAQDDGFPWLRCMTDWVSKDLTTVVDYKTTAGSAHPTQGVPKIASNQGYDFQQAFYERVITSVRPEVAGRLRFEFLVQEVEEPHALCRVSLSEADVAVARRKVDRAIDTWRHCLDAKEWPGYGATLARVNLPAWHFREWLDREMEEMEHGAA